MKAVKMTQRNRGFTLIELLVVIAIIGILASVVLASLNNARVKANRAAVKSNLNAITTQASLYYDDNDQSYNPTGASTNNCTVGLFTHARVKQAINEAESAGGGNATCKIATDGQSWAVSVPFKDDTTATWCVDYTGIATDTAATGGASSEAKCS